jgi:hypothetical protein
MSVGVADWKRRAESTCHKGPQQGLHTEDGRDMVADESASHQNYYRIVTRFTHAMKLKQKQRLMLPPASSSSPPSSSPSITAVVLLFITHGDG